MVSTVTFGDVSSNRVGGVDELSPERVSRERTPTDDFMPDRVGKVLGQLIGTQAFQPLWHHSILTLRYAFLPSCLIAELPNRRFHRAMLMKSRRGTKASALRTRP